MGLFIGDWLNYARTLWEKEVVQKLDTHARDTAWAGMHMDSPQVVNPGDAVAPYTRNSPPDYRLVSDLATGTISVEPIEGGYYQFNFYFTFQASANGGTYPFELYFNGSPSGTGVVVNLSNQSDVGNGALSAFNVVSPSAATDMQFRLDAGATRDISVVRASISVVRLYPLISS